MTMRVGLGGAGDLVAAGLRRLVAQDPEIEVITADGDLSTADVVLYDVFAIQLDDGRELARIVSAGRPVIAVGRPLRPDLACRALERGAIGTVSMEAETHQVLAAIRAIVAREPLPPDTASLSRMHVAEAGLTPREADVLARIAAGADNHQIALDCGISINTVKSAIRKAYRKIGARTRSQAVAWCLQHGFAPTRPRAGS
jgi:DNA-binding NarL/FixJ family response regulator